MKLVELKATASSNDDLIKELNNVLNQIEEIGTIFKLHAQKTARDFERKSAEDFSTFFKEKGFNVQPQGQGQRAWFGSAEILYIIPSVTGGYADGVPFTLEVKETKSNYRKDIRLNVTPSHYFDFTYKNRINEINGLEQKLKFAEDALSRAKIDMSESIEIFIIVNEEGKEIMKNKSLYNILADLEKKEMF